jgi:predicted dehydrogenase
MQRMRVLIVGAGARAGWFVKTLAQRPDTEIAGLCETVPGRAEEMARRHGLAGVPCYPDVRQALAERACDAAFVLTPDGRHAETVVPVLRAGKFAYCEKPLEVTAAGCRAIVAADRRAGGKTFVGFNLRYAPLYEEVHRRVAAGDVGDLLTIQADEFYDGGRTYFRRWNRLRAMSGGLWITKASHDFDLLAWIAAARPLQVFAAAARGYYLPRPDAARLCRDCPRAEECFDAAPARLRESDRQAPRDLCLFNADSDTFDHGIATIRFERDIFATYTCNVVAGFTDRRIRVSGTRGTLDGSLSENTLLWRQRDPSRTERIEPARNDSAHGGADDRILEGFLAFARGEGEPRCRPAEAMLAVEIGLAATRSADSGRAVRMGRAGGRGGRENRKEGQR